MPVAISLDGTRHAAPATPAGLAPPDVYAPVVFAQTTMLHQKFHQLPQIAHVPGLQSPVAVLEPQIARMDVAALEAITPSAGTPAAIPAPATPASPVPTAVTAPVAAPALSLPLPEARPAHLFSLRGAEPPAAELSKAAPGPAPALYAAKPADAPNFLAKLFGQTQPQGQVLAYASPDDGGLRRNLSGAVVRPGYDQWTAVYDISAHTVYLPNGTRLEAHSGLGANFDNPRSVAEHMRGATPPNVYELEPRAQLFHGVRALRLNPVGSGSTYGRAGLLAHTYMLGPRGDTNGCVAFKNYNAFREAYDAGVIKRLAVVDHL